MKIFKIQKVASESNFDLDSFAQDLKELSKKYDVELTSFGAMTTADPKYQTAYVAMWTLRGKMEN